MEPVGHYWGDTPDFFNPMAAGPNPPPLLISNAGALHPVLTSPIRSASLLTATEQPKEEITVLDRSHAAGRVISIDQSRAFFLLETMTGFGSPCGACKFLRRKCVRGCVFAPYFCHEQGAAHFAAIHKVFGASNVSKLLAHLPLADRAEAAVTISYEAQARLRDPIYGCVAHIFALQQQVMTLQAQLASLKAQAAQGQGVHDDAKGGYMGAAAEQLGYGYPWCNGGNGGAGAAGAPAAQPSAYGNGGGHESLTALLGSDCYMQQSLYHAFEQAGADDDDGRQAAAFEAAADSSSFGAEESGWRSSSGYQDCEDLQSVAYAYLNHRS